MQLADAFDHGKRMTPTVTAPVSRRNRELPTVPQNFWKNVAIAAAAKLGMAWGSPGLTHQTTG